MYNPREVSIMLQVAFKEWYSNKGRPNGEDDWKEIMLDAKKLIKASTLICDELGIKYENYGN